MEEQVDVNQETDVSVEETQNDKSSNSLLDIDNSSENEELSFEDGKPKDFPDDFWDSEKNAPNVKAILDKLKETENRVKGLRDKLAKGDNKAPKTPEEYGFSVPEDVADRIKQDDPLITEAAKIAHKYGITKEAYNGFMADMVKHIGSIEVQPQEITPEQARELRDTEMKKIGENGVQVARAVASWVKEMESVGTFDSEMTAAISNAASSGHFVRALNAIRAHYGAGKTVPMNNIDDGLPDDVAIGDMLSKAYKSNDMERIKKVEALLAAREKAGRPTKLQI